MLATNFGLLVTMATKILSNLPEKHKSSIPYQRHALDKIWLVPTSRPQRYCSSLLLTTTTDDRGCQQINWSGASSSCELNFWEYIVVWRHLTSQVYYVILPSWNIFVYFSVLHSKNASNVISERFIYLPLFWVYITQIYSCKYMYKPVKPN